MLLDGYTRLALFLLFDGLNTPSLKCWLLESTSYLLALKFSLLVELLIGSGLVLHDLSVISFLEDAFVCQPWHFRLNGKRVDPLRREESASAESPLLIVRVLSINYSFRVLKQRVLRHLSTFLVSNYLI